MNKILETIGRARLEQSQYSFSIIVKPTLSASFDATPRHVAHVGSERYIKQMWKYFKKNRSKYEKDPVILPNIDSK